MVHFVCFAMTGSQRVLELKVPTLVLGYSMTSHQTLLSQMGMSYRRRTLKNERNCFPTDALEDSRRAQLGTSVEAFRGMMIQATRSKVMYLA